MTVIEEHKLIKHWNYEKNKDLNPETISVHSKKSVWWICDKCGYEWQGTIAGRYKGRGLCPKCELPKTRKKNLVSDNPFLMKYWGYNPELKPEDITVNNDIPVNWECPDCGNKWVKGLRQMYKKQIGCTECNRRMAALNAKMPDLYKSYDFDYKDNPKLEELDTASTDDIHWVCSLCGHQWAEPVWNRLIVRKGGTPAVTNCPACNRNVNRKVSYPDRYPELARLYSHNNSKGFDAFDNNDAIIGSFLWICDKCGNEYEHTFIYMKRHMDNLSMCCPFCNPNQSRISDGESFADMHPELLKEYAESNTINPYSVKPFSKKEATWICSNGHEWKGTFASRHRGKTCPVCAEKSSLQNLFIDVYKNFSTNNNASADKISPDSTTKYLWNCNNCGREFTARVCDMTSGVAECPYCSDNARLAYAYPAYLKYWDYEKNENDPEYTSIKSTTSCHWKCDEEHRYMMPVTTFVEYMDKGEEPCPYCAGRKTPSEQSFAVLFPELMRYWAEDYYPDGISPYSQRSYNWKCQSGHDFRLKMCQLINYYLNDEEPCPYCSERIVDPEKSFAALHPALAGYWDYEKNSFAVGPDHIVDKSKRQYWWKCEDGHSFFKSPFQLVEEYENDIEVCPVCRGTRLVPGVNTLKETHPEFEQYWDDERDFGSYGHRSAEIVHWKCQRCGGSITSPIRDFIAGDYHCKYCEGTRTLKGLNSLADTHPELEQYWVDSNRKFDEYRADNAFWVQWKCPICGGPVYSRIKDFVQGNYDCTTCRGYRALVGFNSLLDTHPELKEYWCEDNERDMSEFTAQSKVLIKFKCPKCGNKIRVPIADYINGNYDCSVCKGIKTLVGYNSLVDTHPELEKYWAEENDRSFSEFREDSSYYAKWYCPECGEKFSTFIRDFVVGDYECPVCNGLRTVVGINSLVDTHPELKKYWDNANERDFSEFSAHNVYVAKWHCPDCNGLLTLSVRDYVDGNYDCPYCNDRRALSGYNTFKIRYPQLMLEWDEISNYALVDPDEVLPSSAENVWWNCPNGHKYRMAINRRVLFDYRGLTACPQCKGLNRKKSHIYKRK